MFKFYFFCLVILWGSKSSAQTTVKITYDANGSRIKREILPDPVISGDRPAPPADSTLAPSVLEDHTSLVAVTDGLFNVYPNPAHNLVQVQVDAASLQAGTLTISILDIQGRAVFRKDILAEITSVDINNLADGTYYVVLQRPNKRETAKFVKRTSASR